MKITQPIINLIFYHLQGADINAQTEETQETALTLACCGGFLDVADFLIKAGADIELGASTPLMEAAQGKYLKSVNLQFNTVGRRDDDMIVPPSDGPMFILID